MNKVVYKVAIHTWIHALNRIKGRGSIIICVQMYASCTPQNYASIYEVLNQRTNLLLRIALNVSPIQSRPLTFNSKCQIPNPSLGSVFLQRDSSVLQREYIRQCPSVFYPHHRRGWRTQKMKKGGIALTLTIQFLLSTLLETAKTVKLLHCALHNKSFFMLTKAMNWINVGWY